MLLVNAGSIDLDGDAALEEFAHEPNRNDGNGAKGDDGDHLQEVDDDGDAALEEFVHEPNPNDSNGAGGDGRDHLQEGDDDSDDDPDYKMVDVIRRPWNTHDFFDVGSLDLSGYNAAWQLDNGVRLLLVGKGEIENIYTPGLCEYIIKYYAKGTNEEIKIFEVSYDEVLENLGKIVAEDNLIFDQKEEEDDMDLVVWMYRRTYDGVDHKIGYANPWKYATEQRLIERVYDVLIEDGAVAGYDTPNQCNITFYQWWGGDEYIELNLAAGYGTDTGARCYSHHGRLDSVPTYLPTYGSQREGGGESSRLREGRKHMKQFVKSNVEDS
ncbi:hypothetical protein ACFX1S_030533 [Malus domestica]